MKPRIDPGWGTLFMLRLIETLYSFDALATDRLLDAMERLTDQAYAGELASRHGSIRDTFAHLLLTEWRFVSWLDGTLSLAETAELTLSAADIPSAARARRRWEAVREQAAWFIASLSEEDLMRDRQGTMPDATELCLPLWTTLLHVVDHNARTRAQIAAALERAGHVSDGANLLGYARTMQIRGSLACQW